MSVASQREYQLTQTKLASLREMIARIEARPTISAAGRSASLRSLRDYANQLVEELVRYEISQGITPLTIERCRTAESLS